MDQTAVLGAVDYVIFIAVLGISSAVGLYFAFTGGRQKTTSEYLLGDRKLHVLPVSMSMFMSFFSAIYILGRNAEVYKYGTQVWLGSLGSAVGYGISAVIFVPLFYPLKLTSIFQVSLIDKIKCLGAEQPMFRLGFLEQDLYKLIIM